MPLFDTKQNTDTVCEIAWYSNSELPHTIK